MWRRATGKNTEYRGKNPQGSAGNAGRIFRLRLKALGQRPVTSEGAGPAAGPTELPGQRSRRARLAEPLARALAYRRADEGLVIEDFEDIVQVLAGRADHLDAGRFGAGRGYGIEG